MKGFVRFGALLGSLGVAFGASAQPNNDFSTVEITAHSVAENIYYLEGRGGNIGVIAGPASTLIIDTQFAPLTEKILTAVGSIAESDIALVINTHVHPDHIGGNENFQALGYPVLAHDNVRVRMAQGLNGGEPYARTALPVMTFSDEMLLHFNGDQVRVFKVPAAHTDGDSFIYIEAADVMHLGDVFRTTGYPVIDVNNGGTAQGTLDALQLVLDIAGPNTKIIPGHGNLSTVDDVREFRTMIAEVTRRVTELVEQDMTFEQVVAAAPTADLDERWGSPDRFLTGLYQSLTGIAPQAP